MELAIRLRDALIAVPGITAWMDESLETGGSWARQIERQINRCDLFIVLLSPDVNREETATQDRSFVLNEIDYAKYEVRKPILPVMAQKTRLPVQLAGAQYIDITQNQDTGIGRLVEEIRKRAGIESPRQRREHEQRELSDTPPGFSRPRISPNRQFTWIGAGLVIFLLAIAGIVFLPGILEDESGRQATEATTEVANVPTQTHPSQTETSSPTAALSDTPEPTNTPSDTPEPTHTPTDEPSETPLTPTLTDTVSPTNTPEPTITPTSERDGAIQLALAGIDSNNEWTPYVEEINGVEMVLVPKGCFMMGSTDEQIDYAIELYGEGAERTWFENEQPAHQQCFDEPFWIDRYEVSNAQFRDFNGQAAEESAWKDDNLPRENITWLEARDFCESRGARLPTEREWEYAARGPDDLIFPWGNEFVADNVVYTGNSDGQTAAVGSRPGGVSWVGAVDVSGNVWEWVSTIYQEKYPYAEDWESNSDDSRARAVRGGGLNIMSINLRTTNRYQDRLDTRSGVIGFRCALSFNS